MIRSRVSTSPEVGSPQPRYAEGCNKKTLPPSAGCYFRFATEKIILFSLFCLLFPCAVSAQYYDQGAAPASLRWSQIRTPHNRIIFPQGFEQGAIAVRQLLDTLRPVVGHDYRRGALGMPVVLQTHNFSSNGLVMRGPTRMELMMSPPAATTPEPWLRQLVTHELRHAVQYHNVDDHFVGGLRWLLGDQGALVGVGLFPIWALEGDAVMAETELATFGRGLQPRFTIDYRAIVDRDHARWSPDKWFSGSYRDHLPSHYELGYQLTTYAYTKYGENVWDRVADYSSRRPWVILTARAALWKYYRTSVKRLLRETIADLEGYWDSLPPVEPTGRIVATPLTSFTTYSSPIAIDGKIVAIKKDLDRIERLVVVEQGEERTLFGLGITNSPLAYDTSSRRLYWSELRRSKLWEQKVNSQLIYADLDASNPRPIRGYRQALFPTPTARGVACVHYDYDGTYSIRLVGQDEPLVSFPPLTSLHGLAYDAAELYFLAVDQHGMRIGRVGSDEPVKAPGHATLGDLRAADGVLYFTSTQSGRDEAHAFDLASGQEWQLSASEYGSFAPAAAGDSVVATTYTSSGYSLAKHPLERTRAVIQAPMPRNVVNPPRNHWEIDFRIDSICVPDTTAFEIRRYRKLPHALNIHSWAPVAFDPYSATNSEDDPDIGVGATILSQDVLSTTTLAARWGMRSGRSLVGAELHYGGLPVKLALSVEAGGGKQGVVAPAGVLPPRLESHFDLEARAYLPILFDQGSHTALLQPAIDYQYDNALLYSDSTHYRQGLHKLVGELYWGDNVRQAHRDFLPRLGYAFSATVAFNPFDERFGTLWGLWGRAYLPGVARHHSLMLRTAVQGQSDGNFHFRQKLLFPRGAAWNIAPKRYAAGAIDYQLPIAYPDRGLTSFVYIKRVRLNLAGYWARYESFAKGNPWHGVWSYGADLTLDMNVLRTPALATNTLTFSLYKPSDRSGWFAGFGFTLPI